VVGKGGENVKQLQNELGGIRLSIESFEDMPEGMDQPNRHWYENKRQNKGWERSPKRGKSGRNKSRR